MDIKKTKELAMRIYLEHMEIMKKFNKLNGNTDELIHHEIAVHYKIMYDKSIELARCVLDYDGE